MAKKDDIIAIAILSIIAFVFTVLLYVFEIGLSVKGYLGIMTVCLAVTVCFSVKCLVKLNREQKSD